MKKVQRLFLFILLTLILVSSSSIAVFASSNPFSGGEGTNTNPYIIENIDQLEAVQFYLDSCFILNNDLTFDEMLFEEDGEYYNNGKGWTPIGKTSSQPFTGTFNGNGKTIKGLKSSSDLGAIGLFGYSSGIVKNLTMEEVYVCGDNASTAYAQCGGIIGYLKNGKLINCKVLSGSVQSSSEGACCGGLVGCLNFNGSVICSSNNSSVSSSDRAGGITGTVGGNRGDIRECFNEGEITGASAGGITGAMYGLRLNDCYNAGTVIGSDYAGGINGSAGNSNYLTNFVNTGIIMGNNNVGSVSGNQNTGNSSGCYTSTSYKQGNRSVDGELISPEMFNQAESFEGFDFDSVWEISDEEPKLKNLNNTIIEHKYVQYPAVEATCTAKGNNEYYICDYCGSVFKSDKTTLTTVNDEDIPAKGHQLVKHEEVVPTCIADGNYEYYTCANCDVAYKKDMVTETLPKFEIWKATGHSWNNDYSIDKEVTCIEDGLQSIHCAICDETKDELVIPTSGHVWNEDYTVDKGATCTEEGTKSIHCSICNAIMEESSQMMGIIPHNFSEWTIIKPATKTETGIETRACISCGRVEDRIIPMLPFDYPSITKQPESITGMEGTKAIILVGAEGKDLSYQWQYSRNNGASWTDCTAITSQTAEFSFILKKKFSRRLYRCIISNDSGTITSESALLTVTTKPVITEQPQDLTGAVGEKVSLRVTAEGEGLTYQWYVRASADADWKVSKCKTAENSTTLTASANGRQLYVIVTDKYGSTVQSNTVTLTVLPSLKITEQPQDVTGAVGDKVTLKVTAEGEGLTYQWYVRASESAAWKKSSRTTATNSATLTAEADGRQLYVEVKDKYGNTVTSSVATLHVSSAELKITSQPQDVTGTIGQKITLKVAAEGEGLTYQWYVRDSENDSWRMSSCTKASNSTKLTAAADGRQLYVTVSDRYGNTVDSAIATIHVE